MFIRLTITPSFTLAPSLSLCLFKLTNDPHDYCWQEQLPLLVWDGYHRCAAWADVPDSVLPCSPKQQSPSCVQAIANCKRRTLPPPPIWVTSVAISREDIILLNNGGTELPSNKDRIIAFHLLPLSSFSGEHNRERERKLESKLFFFFFSPVNNTVIDLSNYHKLIYFNIAHTHTHTVTVYFGVCSVALSFRSFLY